MTSKRIALERLDWDDVRVFLAVARTESVTRAAIRLKLDHSTISRRIAQLELSLGGALFKRHRSGFKPTELAERILRHAETMERGILELRESLGGGAEQPAGHVRIAMMEGIGSMYVARGLLPLRRKHPDIVVELVTSSQLVHVNRREADIFLSFFKPEGRGLHCISPGQFALTLYGSQSYLDELGVPETVADLERHRFVGYIDDLIQVDTVRWLDEVLPNPRIAFCSNSMLAQMTAAASGIGLALLPRFSVPKEDELRPVLEHEVVVRRGLWLSVHQDLQFSSRVRIVLEYLRELLAGDQDWLNIP